MVTICVSFQALIFWADASVITGIPAFRYWSFVSQTSQQNFSKLDSSLLLNKFYLISCKPKESYILLCSLEKKKSKWNLSLVDILNAFISLSRCLFLSKSRLAHQCACACSAGARFHQPVVYLFLLSVLSLSVVFLFNAHVHMQVIRSSTSPSLFQFIFFCFSSKSGQ